MGRRIHDIPGEPNMKITVDAARCSGHGRCYDLSPQVFTSDDEGYCAQKGQTFTVADDLAEAARIGAAGCPEGAITVHSAVMAED